MAIQSQRPDFTHEDTRKIRKSQNFKNGLSFGETDSRVCPTKILRLNSIDFEIGHKGTGLNPFQRRYGPKEDLTKFRMLPKRTIMVDNLSETVNKTSDRKSDFGSIFNNPNYVYSLSFIMKLHL